MQTRVAPAASQQAHHRPSSLCCPPRNTRSRRAVTVVVAALGCPYSTLGVAPNSSDIEIKQAYRKLVLQHHPDIAGTGAERKFMSIQQAYELLTGKSRRGGAADGRGTQQHGDWDFHDWYWSFMQKRRWGSYKKGSAAAAAQAQQQQQHAASAPFHEQPEHKSAIRSQLAGLRHRAAVRAHKQQPAWVAAAADDGAAAGGEQHERQQEQQQQDPAPAMASLEYDSTEMGDGCNMASGVMDWEAAAAAHAATTARRRFSATESRKQQVMSQVAGLHRMAAATQDHAGGLW